MFLGIGFLRIALAAMVAAFAVVEGSAWSAGIYLAAGIGAVFGLLVAVGWPKFLRRKNLASVLLDSLTVSLVHGSTVGKSSLFFPLYLLAALGIVGVFSSIAKSTVGVSALLGGYLAAVAVSAQSLDTLLSSVVGFQTGIILFFCVGAGFVEARQNTKRDNRLTYSALTEGQEYAEGFYSVTSHLGSVLALSAPTEILEWTAETVCESLGASYVHAAVLDGHLHQTSAKGDGDAYPGWCHPEIRRLVSRGCRMGQVQRNSNTIHGIESFLVVPMVSRGSDASGAIVMVRGTLKSEEERSLKLVVSSVALALEEKNGSSGQWMPVAPGDAYEVDARMERTARTLGEATEVRDPYLGEHSRAVSNMARLIGREMALSREQLEALTIGALLHDVGKIGLPDSILHKPVALSAEEREFVKQHPVLGDQILNSAAELAPARPVVKHHHESFDGRGYPDGLRGEGIPFAARIVLVADAFDSMTRDRPYRDKLTVNEALGELERCSGTQFDPAVVEALQRIVRDPEYRQLSS